MRRRVALVAAVIALIAVACGPDDANITKPMTNPTSAPTEESTRTTATAAADPPLGPSRTVLVSFADPASVAGWSNVDDSVMGGVSISRTTWEAGSLVVAGIVSKDNNGGFVSTIGPVDPGLGTRARGAMSIAIGAHLDTGPVGRYLLWLRSADGGRWVAPFTPLATGSCCAVTIPVVDFVPVDRFLRELPSAAPLDPSAIVQLGIYLLPDVPRSAFRLTVTSIDAVS